MITILVVIGLLLGWLSVGGKSNPRLSVTYLKTITGSDPRVFQFGITNVGDCGVFFPVSSGYIEVFGHTNLLAAGRVSGGDNPMRKLGPGQGHVADVVVRDNEIASIDRRWRYTCLAERSELRSWIYRWQWGGPGLGPRGNWLIPPRLRGLRLTVKGTSDWIEPGKLIPAPAVPVHAVKPNGQGVVSRRQLSPEREVLSARFRATVYELQSARANTLVVTSLAHQAATSESLLRALNRFGAARILYDIDQPANVFSEQILVSSSEPVKVAAKLPPNSSLTTYVNVGLILGLSAEIPRRGDRNAKPPVSLLARVSTLGQSQAGLNRKAPVRSARLKQSEPLEFGQARVMLGTNSNPVTALTEPVTYVVRYVFDELPESSGEPLAPNAAPGLAQTASSPNGAQAEFRAQFEATAYEVGLPAERIAALDSAALARNAGTPEKLLGWLGEIGEARITYQISEVVNVLSDEVQVSTNEWIRMNSGSQMLQPFGFHVRFAGIWPTSPAVAPNVTLTMGASGHSQGMVAPRIYSRSISHSEALEFDQPRVMLVGGGLKMG